MKRLRVSIRLAYFWLALAYGLWPAPCHDQGSSIVYHQISYPGVEFYIGAEAHYAWIHVGVPLIGTHGGFIREYGYDTRPDAPILAGAVPEPSTAALISLFGVAFWLLHRQCKQKPRSARPQ